MSAGTATTMLRRVAVTGAGGFVGTALCRRLRAEGLAVRALLRASGAAVPEGCEAFALGDLREPARCRWQAGLDGVDAVFHLAAIAHAPNAADIDRVNVDATAALAGAAFRAGLPLVHVSTVKVYGDESAQPLDENSVTTPSDAYGRSKLRAEQVLADVAGEHAGHWIALRPPIVFGPGDRGNFARLVRLATRGWPLPLASVANRRSMVHAEVLADALWHALALARSAPAGSGRAYVVAGGPAWSIGEWLRHIGAAAGRPSPLWPCPPALLRAAATVLGVRAQAQRLLGSLAVDDRRWRADARWLPALAQEQAVAQSVRSLLDP